MTFFELLKRADTTAKEVKTIIAYKADENNVKTVKKELLSLAKVYNDNSIIGMYADVTECGTVIYKDFLPCLEVATIYNDKEAEKMLNTCRNFTEKVSDYIYYIENKIEIGDWILSLWI